MTIALLNIRLRLIQYLPNVPTKGRPLIRNTAKQHLSHQMPLQLLHKALLFGTMSGKNIVEDNHIIGARECVPIWQLQQIRSAKIQQKPYQRVIFRSRTLRSAL